MPIAEKEPSGSRGRDRRCGGMRGGAREGKQGRLGVGGAATACGRDDDASTPCARPGGARPIGVCGSACVGDKVKEKE